MEAQVISDGTVLGGLAVLVSLAVSGFGLWKNYKLDRDTASKSQFDAVVENYQTLLNKSDLTIARLEKKIDEQDQLILEYKFELEKKNKEIKELRKRVVKLEKYASAD